MFDTREGPCRGNRKQIGIVFCRERAVELRKPQVVANAEAASKFTERQCHQFFARRAGEMLIGGRRREQVRLAVFANELTCGINDGLRIENAFAFAFRNAGDNSKR